MMNMFLIVFFSALLSSTSHASNVNDFCIADLKGPDSPTGYHCLPPDTVTANDFKYNLQSASIPIPLKVVISQATVREFPALNGLGVSAARVDMERGGVFPMHTHPGGTELLIMVEGEMVAGFVTPTKAYVNTLKPGDVMVFPQGQLHFQVNTGKGKAVSYGAFSSPNPRLELLPQNLFGNNITSDSIALTTFLDADQVRKLKARFSGSG